MKTAYIFGAGASYAYDQSPTGVRPPLARGFFQSYKDLPISEDLEVRVGDLINHVRDTYGLSYNKFNSFNQDIEKFMTHLDIQVRQMASMRSELLNYDKPEPLVRFWQSIRVYDEMLFLIAHVLNEIQNGPVSALYAALLTSSAAQDVFITFNWDTLLDKCLVSAGNWSPDDGYGVSFLKLYDNGWRDPKPNALEPKLLKLHGSTNWLVPYITWRLDTGERCMVSPADNKSATTLDWDYQFDPIAKGAGIKLHIGNGPWTSKPIPQPPDRFALPICMIDSSVYYPCYKDRWRTGYRPFSYFFPPDHPETNVPLMPLIVAPVLFKMYDEFAYVLEPLWRAAERELQLADRIVIIGYSFPTTDERAIDLLRSAAARSEQPMVEVVNPHPERIADLLTSLVGFAQNRVSQIPTDFETYINRRTRTTTGTVNTAEQRSSNGNAEQLSEDQFVPITKGRFESFALAAGFERFIVSDEKEWYENPVKHCLGVLCKDRADNDWAYAILTQSEDGLYRWNDGEVSLPSRNEARKRLLSKMKGDNQEYS
jgi:hypothetical protein